MVRALGYALGEAPKPIELDLNNMVNRFGAEAVFGHRLSVREMRDMETAEAASRVLQWFRQREASPDWGDWERKHLQESKILNQLHEEYLKWQTR